MTRLYILCGYPFAGKSTVAQALVERFGVIRVALDEDVTEEQKKYDVYHDRIAKSLASGKSVVTDTVAHKKHSRDNLRELAAQNNAEAVLLYVSTPLVTVKERWQKNRQTHTRHDVKDDVFYEVVNEFEPPTKDENAKKITPEMSVEEIYRLVA